MIDKLRVNPDNPWPGLESYDEEAKEFFRGRDGEIEELLALVKRETLAVLYGRSGLGKTSLLQAGLSPRLRQENYLPIRVHLLLDEGTPGLIEQIGQAIERECRAHQIEVPAFNPGASLWEHFHHRDSDYWSADDHLLTLVLIFDQFEEIFTLGRENLHRRARCDALLIEIGDLVENRQPQILRTRLEEDRKFSAQFDTRKPGPRLLLSFREDYLADFDVLYEYLRARTSNRLRLLPMDGKTAHGAIVSTGSGRVSQNVAETIVRFIDRKEQELESLRVEPALLSLLCRELNEKRIARNEAQISVELIVGGSAQQVIESFYQHCFDGLDVRIKRFVEDRLLTAAGYRDSCALDNALEEPGVSDVALQTLVDRRLLRREERGGMVRLELIHDVLTEVAKASRDTRREAEKLAEAQRIFARQRRKQRWMVATTALLIALLVGVSLLALEAVHSRREATAALTEARKQKQEAEQQKSIAEASRNTALAAEKEATLQREIAESERSAALAAQSKTEVALKQALVANAQEQQARDEARRSLALVEAEASSAALDMAMFGFSQNYDRWQQIVGGTVSSWQSGNRVNIAYGKDILHEYFSKMGLPTKGIDISGFEALDPQASLIQMQGRKPVYLLLELEAASPAKYFMLDKLENPARYFCALAMPQDFPILKRFHGTPGFPWEMQCKLMEAIHLASLDRQVDAEASLERAMELGIFHSGDKINPLDDALYKYLGSVWAKKTSGSSAERTRETRSPTLKERANLVRHVFVLGELVSAMLGRNKHLTSDWKTLKGNALIYPYVKRVLTERISGSDIPNAFGKIEKAHTINSVPNLSAILDALPGPIRRKAMAELQLPEDWERYSGWFERKLAAQAGPAYVDNDFVKNFLRTGWVIETLQDWLKEDPGSSWANYIEAKRLFFEKSGKVSDREIEQMIDTHVLAAANAKDRTNSAVLWAAYRHYKNKRYSESLPFWQDAAKGNSSNLDAPLMEVLTRIELGDPPSSGMLIQLDRTAAMAKEVRARPGDVAEITLARALLRLELNAPHLAPDILAVAYKESQQCANKYFERRNWHERMLKLLDKHRGMICIP